MPEMGEASADKNLYLKFVELPETSADWQRLREGFVWIEDQCLNSLNLAADPELRAKAEALKAVSEEKRLGTAHLLYERHRQATRAYKQLLDNSGESHLYHDVHARILAERQGKGWRDLDPRQVDEFLYRMKAPAGLAFVALRLEESLLQEHDPSLRMAAKAKPASDAAMRAEGLKGRNKFLTEVALQGLGQQSLVDEVMRRANDKYRLLHHLLI